MEANSRTAMFSKPPVIDLKRICRDAGMKQRHGLPDDWYEDPHGMFEGPSDGVSTRALARLVNAVLEEAAKVADGYFDHYNSGCVDAIRALRVPDSDKP